MRKILIDNNRELKTEIETLRVRIQSKTVPSDIAPYKVWLLRCLEQYQNKVEKIFVLLSLEEESIFPEITSMTQELTWSLRTVTSRFVPPLLRNDSSNDFCIKLISWLHRQHPKAKDAIFAISDGNFAILPTLEYPIIYYLPTSSLESIKHMPLIFHEFGHYLYRCHEPEMRDLTIELQNRIRELAYPSYQSDSSPHKNQISKLNNIIERWYEWAHELYCDAVGLQIGGAAYLHTFSSYLRMMGRGQFLLHQEDLLQSDHPVSWVRIHFLAKRASKMGLIRESEKIIEDWSRIAQSIDVKKENYGFYHNSFDTIIVEVIDGMLEETMPIDFRSYLNDKDSIISMVNEAWEIDSKSPEIYSDWERQAVESFLNPCHLVG